MSRLNRLASAPLCSRLALLTGLVLLGGAPCLQAQSWPLGLDVFRRETLHAAAPTRSANSPLRVTGISLGRDARRELSWLPEVRTSPDHSLRRPPELPRPASAWLDAPLPAASARVDTSSRSAWDTGRGSFDSSALVQSAGNARVPRSAEPRVSVSRPNASALLARDIVRCAEPGMPGMRERRTTARVGWLVEPLEQRRLRWDETAMHGESVDLPSEHGLHQRRLFDVRIAGQDIAFEWTAGSSSEGVRPSSGSGLSLATAGDSEIIELSWGAAESGSLSSFVRARRQSEDDYASAFGRSMQGTAGLQFDPGGRWDWRLQAQQQFVNHVTDPIESMEFSLWARLRF